MMIDLWMCTQSYATVILCRIKRYVAVVNPTPCTKGWCRLITARESLQGMVLLVFIQKPSPRRGLAHSTVLQRYAGPLDPGHPT